MIVTVHTVVGIDSQLSAMAAAGNSQTVLLIVNSQYE